MLSPAEEDVRPRRQPAAAAAAAAAAVIVVGGGDDGETLAAIEYGGADVVGEALRQARRRLDMCARARADHYHDCTLFSCALPLDTRRGVHITGSQAHILQACAL